MRTRQERGYTLVELLVVVGILALIAMVAVPKTSSNDDTRLAIAASEFAEAIRFAHSESTRLGEPRGFHQEDGPKRIRVFRLDTSVSPAAVVYDVRHPITKQLYEIELDKHPFAFADTAVHAAKYRGTCNKEDSIYFDRTGVARCTEPENVLLEKYAVTLTLGASARVVALQGYTGRVTVQ